MKAPWTIALVAIGVSVSATRAHEVYPLSIPVPRGAATPVYKRLAVTARDGIQLIVHEWAPTRHAEGTPVALFLHGIGMHGEPYGSIAAGFTSQGIAFIVPDLRGHGRSDGTRGELAPPPVIRSDVGILIDSIHRRHPDAPVVLLGDSMGGLLAADYAWRGEQRLAGLALLVPAFGLNKAQWGNSGGDLINLLTSGGISLATEKKMRPSTQSAGFLKARLADKLALSDVSRDYLTTIGGLQSEWRRAAAEIKVPLFVCVAGEDRIIDNDRVRRFFDRAATPTEEKTWRKIDGAYHTVCWDPATPELIAELSAWILKRSK
jgi:alpha-beta hydrolase superfamily lysophospholipase